MDQSRQKFFKHLWGYIITNIILLIIDWFATAHNWWVIWVVVIWGIFIVIHAIAAFRREEK